MRLFLLALSMFLLASLSHAAASLPVFRAPVQVFASCTGQPATIKVDFIPYYAKNASADVFLISKGGGAKVFSQQALEGASLTFVPEEAGVYELRLSSGAEQVTRSFSVGLCNPGRLPENQEAAPNQAGAQLALYRTFSYASGISKEFKVYNQGSSEDYYTEITITYSHSGNKSGQNLTITDTIPKGVLSSASQISFENYPSGIENSTGIALSWQVRPMQGGESAKFTYRFARQLTDQMIGSFPAPAIASTNQSAAPASGHESGPDVASSLFSLSGLKTDYSALLLWGGGLLLLFLAARAIFGNGD